MQVRWIFGSGSALPVTVADACRKAEPADVEKMMRSAGSPAHCTSGTVRTTLAFALVATAAFAAGESDSDEAAAAEQEMVLDPSTGEMEKRLNTVA